MSQAWRSAPARFAFSITPSDTVNFATNTRGIYVGGAGDVVVVTEGDGSVVTFVGAVAGTVIPINASRLNSTSTTATSLVGMY